MNKGHFDANSTKLLPISLDHLITHQCTKQECKFHLQPPIHDMLGTQIQDSQRVGITLEILHHSAFKLPTNGGAIPCQ